MGIIQEVFSSQRIDDGADEELKLTLRQVCIGRLFVLQRKRQNVTLLCLKTMLFISPKSYCLQSCWIFYRCGALELCVLILKDPQLNVAMPIICLRDVIESGHLITAVELDLGRDATVNRVCWW